MRGNTQVNHSRTPMPSTMRASRLFAREDGDGV